ncbi:chitinase [Nocardia alni]|uniref:chitinase n=1 Tax=Nocardia alni TaxID=2815723 RepID=UPI001C222BA1|nr:chitinase [Nocardia alni]
MLNAVMVACGLMVAGGAVPAAAAGTFVISESQFDRMFPNRNAFYTYRGLADALGAYPEFTTTGSDAVRKREAAAFLANVSHETVGLKFIVEQNRANYSHYCDRSQPYGCPAGQSAYYGRGPLQLSWNFNYKAAGDALHVDLLSNPYAVERDATVSWKTGLWFWNSQAGAGTMTPHDAMVRGKGFGETIRSINGDLECHGKNPDERNDRIDLYKKFVEVLGTDVGPGNLSC